MKIVYVHHGIRDNNTTQLSDLHPLGVKDAKNIALTLKNIKNKGAKIRAIYTSPYLRCIKTAKIINKKLDVEIIEEERLNEFDSKNETWVALQNRVKDVVKEIVQKYDDDEFVILVTSGVNIAGLLNLAYGVEASDKAPFLWVPSCSPIIFNISKDHFKDKKEQSKSAKCR